MDSIEGPRFARVTDDDHGALIAIAAWFLMCAMILSVIVRLMVRIIITRAPGLEDATVFGAMLFGIAQVVAISLAVKSGLGQRQDLLDPSALPKIMKASYVSDLFYIPTLCLAKLSILQLLARLAVAKKQILSCRITSAVIGAWGIVGLFIYAFRCGLGKAWEPNHPKCIDAMSFWIGIGVIDVLTEFAILAIPAQIVWTVQISRTKKIIVMSAFFFRIIVIGSTITRLYYLHISSTSADQTFTAVPTAISTQCTVALSIITACIPTLKPFMDGFDSGRFGNNLRHRTTGGTAKSYRMQTFGSGRAGLGSDNEHSEKGDSNALGHRAGGNNKARGKGFRPDVSYSVAEVTAEGGPKEEADAGSASSVRSDKMIIRRTDNWNVRFEDEGRASALGSAEGEGVVGMRAGEAV